VWLAIERGIDMGKKVFITGATSGIGRATAEAFAKNGDNLLLCGRRAERLEEIQNALERMYKVNVSIFVLDVTNREAVESIVPEQIQKFGGIDVLVNNAGLAQGLEPFQDSSIDDMETMVDTNVKGVLYIARTVLPIMVAQNSGHIINLGSTAGIYAYPNGTVYCATKAAIKTISDGIRMDTIASDIRVTNIQPGIVETPFSEVRFHGDKERAAAVYAGIESLQPENIADVIVFAASQPKHVQISDVTIMANQQAAGFMISKKN